MSVTGSPLLARIFSEICSPVTGWPSTVTIVSPGRTIVGRRGARIDLRDRAVDLRRHAEHEDDGEEHDREDEVREGARRDDGHALPHRRAPVGVGRDAVVHVLQSALRRLAGGLGEIGALECRTQVVETGARVVEPALVERLLDGLEVRREPRSLLDRPAELGLEVGPGRLVHTRDLHVAAEGIAPMPYSIPFRRHFTSAGGKKM